MERAFEDFRAHIEDIARQVAEETARATVEQIQTQQNKRKNLVDGKQAAAHLGISVPTLIRRRNSGEIPGYRLGHRVMYDLREIEESLQSTRRIKKGGHQDG